MTSEEATSKPEPDSADDVISGQKHPYNPPRLTVYGDARELTQAVGRKGKKDGSGSRKTGF